VSDRTLIERDREELYPFPERYKDRIGRYAVFSWWGMAPHWVLAESSDVLADGERRYEHVLFSDRRHSHMWHETCLVDLDDKEWIKRSWLDE
jgi:hypothetical protein